MFLYSWRTGILEIAYILDSHYNAPVVPFQESAVPSIINCSFSMCTYVCFREDTITVNTRQLIGFSRA